MASPASTGTDDSTGLVGSTDTSGSPGLRSPPPVAHSHPGAPSPLVTSPPGAASLPTPTITGGLSVSPLTSTPSTRLPILDILKCPWCLEPFREPKVLACFHTFCKPCLEGLLKHPGKVICPQCNAETQLCPELGVESLLNDYGLANVLQNGSNGAENGVCGESPSSSPGSERGASASPGVQSATCTGCKSKDSAAVAHCQDCTNFLCANCVMAHQYMHCFEGHRVRDLGEFDSRTLVLLAAASADRPVACLSHRSESVRYFCFTCNIPICRECCASEHPRGLHQFEAIQEIAEKQLESMQTLLAEAQTKKLSLGHMFHGVETSAHRLRQSYLKAQNDINDGATFLGQLVEEHRQNALRELETAHNAKQVTLAMMDKKLQQTSEKLNQTIEFMGRLLKFASPTEALVFKKLLETRLQVILGHQSEVQNLGSHSELEFVTPNSQGSRSAIASAFGFVRGAVETLTKPPNPIARPPSRSRAAPGAPAAPTQLLNGVHQPAHAFSDSNLLQTKDHYGGSSQSLPFSVASDPQSSVFGAPYTYEKWSSGGSDVPSHNSIPATLHVNTDTGAFHNFASSPEQVVVDRISGLFPPRSQIKRHKMIYHCKFGEFGVMEGQFTEPSGVAVNSQNDIIVADTNNHRIQMFDREGRFKFQFGECGKRDGQLLYPNRVAVNRATGDIVVTERSPTHQIQVYNQYGQFLRKFGANILQHPRGVTVDCKGRIVVIECKVMRVLIFDMYGNILQKFSCSRYLEFPNGVCTNDKQEIFISDNRAHCIKVFNYEGQFLRQLGGEGITNYPIGVGINHLGEVVVADNHNNFNLTIFGQDGTLVNALESKVKHAQCFDVALLEEGSVVLASKDYRLYLYRYMQTPQFPL